MVCQGEGNTAGHPNVFKGGTAVPWLKFTSSFFFSFLFLSSGDPQWSQKRQIKQSPVPWDQKQPQLFFRGKAWCSYLKWADGWLLWEMTFSFSSYRFVLTHAASGLHRLLFFFSCHTTGGSEASIPPCFAWIVRSTCLIHLACLQNRTSLWSMIFSYHRQFGYLHVFMLCMDCVLNMFDSPQTFFLRQSKPVSVDLLTPQAVLISLDSAVTLFLSSHTTGSSDAFGSSRHVFCPLTPQAVWMPSDSARKPHR